MFDKLKQMKQLKDLQDSLKKEEVEYEKNGVKVTINGKMEILEIKLNSELDIQTQERVLKDCINEVMKKVQMVAAQKLSQSGFGL